VEDLVQQLKKLHKPSPKPIAKPDTEPKKDTTLKDNKPTGCNTD
jgi:hypothetical protein